MPLGVLGVGQFTRQMMLVLMLHQQSQSTEDCLVLSIVKLKLHRHLCVFGCDGTFQVFWVRSSSAKRKVLD